ncbi:hypothetical protein PG991_001492 [Apiospora marii]|uniref:Uncharacterized protein n=1 Tax=Apiospora marii TaxID=335849 RepID=A0ABR1SS90_9PEZI
MQKTHPTKPDDPTAVASPRRARVGRHRTAFFRAMYSVSRRYPSRPPDYRLDKVESVMSEQGISLCQHFNLFRHILEESPRSQRSRSPGYHFALDDSQPKPVDSLDAMAPFTFAQYDREPKPVDSLDDRAPGHAFAQYEWQPEPVGSLDVRSVSSAVQKLLASDGATPASCETTLLEHLQRAVARDVLAFERMKKLYELGWPLEKIRFSLIHPNLRTANCFIAGSGPDEDVADAETEYQTLLADLDRGEVIADKPTIPGSEGNTEVQLIEDAADDIQADKAAEFAEDLVMDDAYSTAAFDAEPRIQPAGSRVLRLPLFGAAFRSSSVTSHYLGRVRLNEMVLRPIHDQKVLVDDPTFQSIIPVYTGIFHAT